MNIYLLKDKTDVRVTNLKINQKIIFPDTNISCLFMRVTWLLIGTMIILLALNSITSAQMREEVFLPNTDHELHVYRVLGDEPGKTMMIVGGIQGDEPSGYITADLYADIHLKKGNLIVVPRANFYSILLSRRNGQTGDMNRKFSTNSGKKGPQHFEEEVVTVLKHLIAESDVMLNLHEGSGYYNPKYVGQMENPDRYGQSIIFDSAKYTPPYGNSTIYLSEIAERVIQDVNNQITKKRFHFKPNNHQTLSKKTSHKEQRDSATYYALTRAHIPAFGIETSKMIKSLETKISLHKLVINAMMDEFGIVHDAPGMTIQEPKLQYLVVKVNDTHPYALQHEETLELNVGDQVLITDILANYPRGLVADVDMFGSTNDTNRLFTFSKATRIFVRKDSFICGWIDLKRKDKGKVLKKQLAVQPDKQDIPLSQLKAKSLMIDVDGELRTIANKQTLVVPRTGRLIMQGIQTNISELDQNIFVNFKGFAPPKMINDGNDLLYPIYAEHDLISKFSVNRRGKKYPIIANYKDHVIGHFWVEIH